MVEQERDIVLSDFGAIEDAYRIKDFDVLRYLMDVGADFSKVSVAEKQALGVDDSVDTKCAF
jgi:hypothetical protein